MNGKFYAVYAVLLLMANWIFVMRVIYYGLLIKEGVEKFRAEVDADKQEYIYKKLSFARINFDAWIAIALCGFYANIDCILNIWRFW